MLPGYVSSLEICLILKMIERSVIAGSSGEVTQERIQCSPFIQQCEILICFSIRRKYSDSRTQGVLTTVTCTRVCEDS